LERQSVFSFNFGLMMAATFFGYTIGGALPTWIGALVGVAATSTPAYQAAIGLLGVVPIGVALGVAVFAFNARIALMNMGNPIYQTFVLEHVAADVRAMSMSLLSISFQFGWFVMPQVSGSLQVLFGDFGFVPVFAGVIPWWHRRGRSRHRHHRTS
jgi:hypothetical protein